MRSHSVNDQSIAINQPSTRYLSCDNTDDAIRSLALAYNIDEERISRVFQQEWPDFLPIDVENEFFRDTRLTWIMARYMGCSDVTDCSLPSAHYHRGLFNGDKNWFERGLLNSEEGAEAFLEYLRPKLPTGCDFARIRAFALSNIFERTQGESELGGGPYAFDRLDDAKGAQDVGLDYSIPEFFMGRIWDLNRDTSCDISMLREICKRNFMPVVVKFEAKCFKNQAYVNNLWHYLHRKKFQIDLEPNSYTFNGGGHAIPHAQIIELFVSPSNLVSFYS